MRNPLLSQTKPKNARLDFQKPKMGKVTGETETTYYDDNTILKGQPMGLLLAITYPAQLDFEAERGYYS